jgi:methionyl-tRNA synthetase
MNKKYFEGVVQEHNVSEDLDKDLIDSITSLHTRVTAKMDELRVGEAIQEIFEVLRRCNKYIDDTMPWSLAKEESKKERLGTVLYNLLESIRICAVLLSPFLPETSEKILAQLNTEVADFDSTKKFGCLEVGSTLAEPVHLFDRIEVKKD